MSGLTSIEIPLAKKPVCGTITPPGSKSITNRALVMAALAAGESRLIRPLDSDDTRVMIQAWRSLGLKLETAADFSQIVVSGLGGRLPNVQAVPKGQTGLEATSPQPLFMENSGTSIRFLTAALAATGGRFVLSGVPRMQQRPIGDLGSALRQLGAQVHCRDDQFPPVEIDSQGLAGGHAAVAGDLSSQYLSGLLMAAPLAQTPVTLAVAGDLVSQPYVAMTCQVMKSFGVQVQVADNTYSIRPQSYQPQTYTIEPDASAASYFWAAAAITGGNVLVKGLDRSSLQGDVGFVECLARMGCQVSFEDGGTRVIGPATRLSTSPTSGSNPTGLKAIDVDMNSISDTVQTLAAVALFADGTTRVRGVAHNRHKETDRIEDLATELRRVGAIVETFADGLSITPARLRPAEIQTYHDHRMAMSLSLIGLRQPGIVITNPGCTAKTYPHFFPDLLGLSQ